MQKKISISVSDKFIELLDKEAQSTNLKKSTIVEVYVTERIKQLESEV